MRLLRVLTTSLSLSLSRSLSAGSARSIAGTSTSKVGAMAETSVDVITLPMWKDNYAYVVIDKATKQAAVVDPGEGPPVAQKILELQAAGGWRLTQLWCTHKHDDHAGGNAAFKATFPALEVIGTQHEPVPALTRGVGEGDSFTLGESSVAVMYVPCHTAGHVAFVVTSGRQVLFPGDTLFVGGCGRFFEGTGADMLKNMDRFAALPSDCLVYPAHEYTESNLKFLASVDPEGSETVYADVRERRARGVFTVPTTIGAELTYNLFIKTREERVQTLVGTPGDAEACMNKLRAMKNTF